MAKKILIVEDDESIRMLEERILKRSKYEVDTTPDGMDVLSLLKKKKYDLLILDVMLPDTDGFTLAEKIINEIDDPPVFIFVTAKDDPKSYAKGFEAGGAFYITKPFSSMTLLQAVKTCIGEP